MDLCFPTELITEYIFPYLDWEDIIKIYNINERLTYIIKENIRPMIKQTIINIDMIGIFKDNHSSNKNYISYCIYYCFKQTEDTYESYNITFEKIVNFISSKTESKHIEDLYQICRVAWRSISTEEIHASFKFTYKMHVLFNYPLNIVFDMINYDTPYTSLWVKNDKDILYVYNKLIKNSLPNATYDNIRLILTNIITVKCLDNFIELYEHNIPSSILCNCFFRIDIRYQDILLKYVIKKNVYIEDACSLINAISKTVVNKQMLISLVEDIKN